LSSLLAKQKASQTGTILGLYCKIYSFMKEIIIATGNQDKFQQIASLLTALNVNTSRFLSLSDLDIYSDLAETGTLLARAKQKAFYCLSQIKPRDYSNYLCIVANDTGTKLPTLNIETTESKKISSEILKGNLIKAGEPINYLYSYAFILLPSQKLMTAEVEIPFTYLGNPNHLVPIEGQNIMNQVKALVGQNIPHSQLLESEVIEYRLGFLRKELSPIIEQINILE
jgi:hypothetical protein